MNPARSTARILVLALALAAVGCARKVAVESSSGAAFSLEVINPGDQDMVVSYNDGTGTQLLGTVQASSRERFVVTSPARSSITVSATNEARTRTVRKQVTLQPGVVTTVRLTR